jgi:hypothetical protein
LRLIDDSLKTIAEKEIGSVVPADFIFTQTRADLIQAGLLLNDTSNLIQGKKAKGGDEEIEGRILSAVFLLDQITSNISDTGIKSNDNTIADILIDNLNVNSDAFRTKVKGLVKKLVEPFTQFQKDNSILALAYTGYSDNKTDFVDVNGKTYSVKSNIRKNGKVCPQVIGQPTKRKFIENVYNPINNLEQDTSISETDIKQNFFKCTDQYLNLYFQYLFCCDYIIHICITETETDNASDFQFKLKLIDKMKFTFEKEKITFSNTCENWNESITVKYDNVSIGEFQMHRKRDSIKFRFIIDNLLTFLK